MCSLYITSKTPSQAQVEPLRLRGAGPGVGIFLFARYAHATAGFTAYGRKGLPAEHVAEIACQVTLEQATRPQALAE